MKHFEYGAIVQTISATPALNSPHFAELFSSELPLDDQGLFRPLETIFLKGAILKVENLLKGGIYSIVSPHYFASKLYVDYRFLELAKESREDPIIKMPSVQVLKQRLEALMGKPYVWGGNYSKGVPEMLDYYPPKKELSPTQLAIWTMQGVDCSGLLYEITDGATPRNTSQLINFGTKVKIENKEILPLLKPLDLIVWPGHIVIVLDSETCIESRLGYGVYKSPLDKRLAEILQTRTPADEFTHAPEFVVRRFHPETRF